MKEKSQPSYSIEAERENQLIENLCYKIYEIGSLNWQAEDQILEAILKVRFEEKIPTVRLIRLVDNKLKKMDVPAETTVKISQLIAISGAFSLEDNDYYEALKGFPSHLVEQAALWRRTKFLKYKNLAQEEEEEI